MKAFVVWNSWSRRYPPPMRENLLPVRIIGRQKATYYIRRHLYKPPCLLYCGECTWTRISRRPIVVITWPFSQQILLEPLTVTGARASCFGERYRDVLQVYQNLDKNTVCWYTDFVCSYVESNSVRLVAHDDTPLLLRRQQGGEPTKRHMECGTACETSIPPLKCGCFSSAA